MQFIQTIKTERGGKPEVEVLEERDISTNHKFYSSLKDGNAEEEQEEVSYIAVYSWTCTYINRH